MDRLKPTKVEADLLYKCNCGAENWLTLTESKVYGKFVCIICGKASPVEPIKNVIIQYAQQSDSQLVKVVNEPVKISGGVPIVRSNRAIVQSDLDQFIPTLISFGYKRAQAKLLVQQCNSEYTGDDAAFISLLISRSKICNT